MIILDIILIFSCIASIIIAIRYDNLLTLFYSLAFTTLYVGQYFYLHYTSESNWITILREYGYERSTAQYILIYLILIFFSISSATYLAAKYGNSSKKNNVVGSYPIHNISRKTQIFYITMMLGVITIYGSIIGWKSFWDVRPNFNRGGTFGLFLCLSVSVAACKLWCTNKISILNLFIFMISTCILVLAGARITVIYFWLTLAFIVTKHRGLKLGYSLLFMSIIASVIVLILGQAFKELTGGQVELNSFWDSVLFTSGAFYIAQTEAFVSTASTLQFQIDQENIPVNGGITILNFINLLLPSFLKAHFTTDLSSLIVYNKSIIPSAGSFFLQGFFYYGVLLHCAAIFMTIWYYHRVRWKIIRPNLEVYLFFIFSVCGVNLTRGPLDLIPFTIVAVGVMLSFIFFLQRIFKIK